jgi:hypothetical protein
MLSKHWVMMFYIKKILAKRIPVIITGVTGKVNVVKVSIKCENVSNNRVKVLI